MADFFSFEPWELLAQILGELSFDQVILRLFLVSRILAQSTKIWWHCIITFLHCTISYASSHKCGYNLEQECKYLMQSWMYLILPCCHRILSLASSGLLQLELYLEPHPLDLPCASHALLAIMYHLVCGANSHWFSHAQLLSLWANRDYFWTLRTPPLLSVTILRWERKSIARLVNFSGHLSSRDRSCTPWVKLI
jgi:hypothetical protein